MKRRFKRWVRKYNEDLFVFAGFTSILIGAYHLHPLAAWFVGGVECLIVAILIAWSKRK